MVNDPTPSRLSKKSATSCPSTPLYQFLNLEDVQSSNILISVFSVLYATDTVTPIAVPTIISVFKDHSSAR
jgi:hypothetical protein